MWRSVIVFLLIYRVLASQNLAKYKLADQSSLLPYQPTWNAQKAVDGNRRQNVWCGSCLFTRVTGRDAYLNISLGGPSAIKRVEIYYRQRYTNRCNVDSVLNMTDNGSNYRFKGYRIDIDDVTCYQDRSQPFPEPYQNNSCVGTGVNVKVIQVNKPETEPNLAGPLLELCEVEVYGCQIEWYGPGCNDPCDMKCLEGMCDPDNGDCLRGCVDGYRGQQCNLECNDGWFGANCSSKCANCYNQSCRHTDGVCLQGCDKGYMGSNCNQSCSEGWFGYNCSRRCGECSAGTYCDRITGHCSAGCETGYEAPLCLEECPVYTYGENCWMICGECKNHSTCHHVTGICNNGCEAGWIEEQCQTQCYNGTYGTNCEASCGNCKTGLCHHKDGKCIEGCSEGWEPPYCTQRVRSPQSDNIGMIGGIIATLVVMALATLVIILWRRRRHGQQQDKTKGEEVLSVDYNKSSKAVKYMTNLVTENDGTTNTAGDVYCEIVDDGEQEASYEVLIPNNSGVLSKLHETNMLVSDLRMTIQEKKEQRMLALEFSRLTKGAVHPHNVGKMPENMPKNRFLTVFPYDHSLVKLSTSAYINANFINGVEKSKMYIATQGPKSNTIVDFWQMIWEKNSGKIVMLTDIIEFGKRKCERYWPSDIGQHLDIKPYRLTLKKESFYGAFTKRLIQIKNTESNKHRNVHHFQFTTWPDHGTPDTFQLVFFHHIIDRTETKHTGPVIVHCSSGLGRTGTYIALDALQCWMKFHTTVDVHKFTEKMRKDRMDMIQTLNQYVELHEALLETLTLMNTDICSKDFPEMWIRQRRQDISKNKLRIKAEFQKIQVHRPTLNNSDRLHGLDEENISKNRSADVLPMLKYRPDLLSRPPSRSNYINAVIVPTLAHQNGFIMTQCPLADTVQDFWCLVYDQDSSVVVILEPNEEAKLRSVVICTYQRQNSRSVKV